MAMYENGMAPITQSVNQEKADVPKSFFDLSRVHQCQGIIGAEMPIDLIKTVPNDDINLSYLMMVASRNPLARELRNGMTVTLHAYWSPCSELWEGWNNYITKGRSGTVNIEVPKLLPDFKHSGDSDNTYTTFVPCSPADYMGVPIRQFDSAQLSDNGNYNYVFKAEKLNTSKVVNKGFSTSSTTMGKWGINALPFVMYNKIHRDYYMNQNLMQNNTNWFPNNDKDFILPYDCTTSNDTTWESAITHNYVNNISKTNFYDHTYNDSDQEYRGDLITKPHLNKLHFRQFRGDYFTSANPFSDLLRGNNTEIDKAIGNTVDFDFTSHSSKWLWVNGLYSANPKATGGSQGDLGTELINGVYTAQLGLGTLANGMTPYKANEYMENRFKESSKVTPGLLNKLRKAVVLEKFMQRNGTTNGTYREIIGVQFGYKPNQFDGKPRYIGGGAFNIDFNSITMTSSDTATQNTGDKVSSGLGGGNINIGSYHCDDYGYIMVIATILPDIYYNRQGLETMWTTTTQDKEYMPIMNNLEPQPILNKEMYLDTDSNNNDVFGYAERFADMKSRQNIATGLCACGNTLAPFDSNNLMHRQFNAVPQLNNEFVTMYPDKIDLNPFYSTKEIPFDMMIGCKVGANRPMPYSSKPADMGIAY